MQVTVEEISPVEKKVAVQIEWPMVAAKLDEAYRELARGVTLKGFRKGKVPRNILEKMYSRHIEKEVTEKLVQESFMRAAQQHEIALVAEPIVDDIKFVKGSGFEYSARVEVRAPFEVDHYSGVELERAAAVVTDEEIERAVKNKQREFTEFKKIEGREALQQGDVAFLDLAGEVGPHPVKRDGVMVEVGSSEAGEALPGLGAALVGVALGAANLELNFTVPEAVDAAAPAEQRDIAGKPARLMITVREAREKLVPALDDEFAKDTGEADSLDGLRAKLKEKLVAEHDKELDRGLRGELIKAVLAKNPFPVAPALIERQVEAQVRNAKLQMAMRGIDPRTAAIDEVKLKDEVRPAATDEVRAWFLLDAIGTKEKIEVSDADLEKKLAEMAKERGKNVPKLKAELQKDGKLEQVRHNLREEKTLDLLMSRANITMKANQS